MSQYASAVLATFIWSIFTQLGANGETPDQIGSIPYTGVIQLHPNSSVNDTYGYFCNDNITLIFNDLVECRPRDREVVVRMFFCLTYNEDKGIFLVGRCPFLSTAKGIKNINGFHLPKTITSLTRFNEDVMCQDLNRKGVSCGKCNDHSAVAINSYSFECMNIEKCHNYNWIYLLLADLVPVALLFLIVILFDINITSGYANSYILFSQIVSLQVSIINIEYGLAFITKNYLHATYITLTLVSFYSIWNLDLGRSLTPNVCVGHSIETIDSIALQYMSAFYGLGLVFITYCIVELHGYNFRLIVWLWKPFSKCFTRVRRRVNPRASLINAFATFLLLSYSKLTLTSIMLLTPSYLYNQTGHPVTTVLLYDGTLGLFQNDKHICLVVFAISIFIIFVLLPPLLLFLYPWRHFQSFLTHFKLHRPGLITFMDAFQGCYKDGSDGMKDCRWFSGYYFIFRICICIVFIIVEDNSIHHRLSQQLIRQAMYLFSGILILYIEPYKRRLYNKIDITLSFLCLYISSLTIVNIFHEITNTSSHLEVILFVSISLPLLVAILFVLYHIILRLKKIVCFCLITCSRFRHAQTNCPLNGIINDAYESQERKDLTPSLPDRLLQPHLYSGYQDYSIVQSNYGSIGPPVP